MDNPQIRSVFCGNSALGSENKKEKLYPMYELRKMQLVRGEKLLILFCSVRARKVLFYKDFSVPSTENGEIEKSLQFYVDKRRNAIFGLTMESPFTIIRPDQCGERCPA